MNSKPLKNILISLIILLIIGILMLVILPCIPTGKSTKVGYIMTGSTDEAGWNGMNYNGIKAACDSLGVRLEIKENILENTESNDCVKAISSLADKGCEMIILSSYGYPSEVRDTIDEYPEISFYGNSSDYYSDNMTSYFARMYQARYLSGIVAGMTTETDNIGYVAAMQNNEVIRGLNAFTLGVKRVNPDANVYVKWTDSWEDEEKETAAAEYLINEKDIDVITYHQNRNYVVSVAEKAGIYSIGYNEATEGASDKHLTSAVWNWEELYSDIVSDFLQGKANERQHIWCGIETGAVELAPYSPLVTAETQAEVEKAKNEILSGKDVFSGKIYDTDGNLRCDENEFISDTALMSEFDWYVDGVIICE